MASFTCHFPIIPQIEYNSPMPGKDIDQIFGYALLSENFRKRFLSRERRHELLEQFILESSSKLTPMERQILESLPDFGLDGEGLRNMAQKCIDIGLLEKSDFD